MQNLPTTADPFIVTLTGVKVVNENDTQQRLFDEQTVINTTDKSNKIYHAGTMRTDGTLALAEQPQQATELRTMLPQFNQKPEQQMAGIHDANLVVVIFNTNDKSHWQAFINNNLTHYLSSLKQTGKEVKFMPVIMAGIFDDPTAELQDMLNNMDGSKPKNPLLRLLGMQGDNAKYLLPIKKVSGRDAIRNHIDQATETIQQAAAQQKTGWRATLSNWLRNLKIALFGDAATTEPPSSTQDADTQHRSSVTVKPKPAQAYKPQQNTTLSTQATTTQSEDTTKKQNQISKDTLSKK